MSEQSSRHASLDTFEEYLRSGRPVEFPIKGKPRLFILIDPKRPAVGLRVPRRAEQPVPVTGLEHVLVTATQVAGQRFLDVLVTDHRLFIDAYPVLVAIADRIQVDGLSLEAALHDTLRILGRLLEREASFGREREVGLFGELLLLRSFVARIGSAEAVGAWLGAQGEEHDFSLRGIDLEVKTTTAEQRMHWIDSLQQLVPKPKTPLWMVSFQLTEAGPSDGSTLPELIGSVRGAFGHGQPREQFEERLARSGWHDQFNPVTWTRWRQRGRPQAYRVGDDFPRITKGLLEATPVNLERLVEVRYRINLTHQPFGGIPEFLAGALGQGGGK